METAIAYMRETAGRSPKVMQDSEKFESELSNLPE